jgi:hypothetical protein
MPRMVRREILRHMSSYMKQSGTFPPRAPPGVKAKPTYFVLSTLYEVMTPAEAKPEGP